MKKRPRFEGNKLNVLASVKDKKKSTGGVSGQGKPVLRRLILLLFDLHFHLVKLRRRLAVTFLLSV